MKKRCLRLLAWTFCTVLAELWLFSTPIHAQANDALLIIDSCDDTQAPLVTCDIRLESQSGAGMTNSDPASLEVVVDNGAPLLNVQIERKQIYNIMLTTDLDIDSRDLIRTAVLDTILAPSWLAKGDKVAFVPITGTTVLGDMLNPPIDPLVESEFKEVQQNRNELRNKLYLLLEHLSFEATSVGTQALYDGLCKAMILAAKPVDGERVVIVFSKGLDGTSRICRRDDPILQAQKNITVFVIGLGTKRDDAYLQRLASAPTHYFPIDNTSTIGAALNEIQQHFKLQYKVTFVALPKPDCREGIEHTVTISMNFPTGRATNTTKVYGCPMVPQISKPEITPAGYWWNRKSQHRIVAAINGRQIEKVECLVDGEVIATSQQPPYACLWDTRNVEFTQPYSVAVRALPDINKPDILGLSPAISTPIAISPQVSMKTLAYVLLMATVLASILTVKLRRSWLAPDLVRTRYETDGLDDGSDRHTDKTSVYDYQGQGSEESYQGSASQPRAYLEFINGPLKDSRKPIGMAGAPVVIGRQVNGAARAIVLNNPYISKKHVQIFEDNDVLWLEDLDSTSGSRVNGKPVKHGSKAVIEPGDRIEFADIQAVVRAVEAESEA